jgi:hypothetical protein
MGLRGRIRVQKMFKETGRVGLHWQPENNDAICPLGRPISLGPQSFVKNVIIVTLMFRRQMLLSVWF